MILAHKIALDPTPEQRVYFAKAAGTARFTWNWALAEWKRQYEAGEKPSYAKLSRQFTREIKSNPELAWVKEVHNKVYRRPFFNLGKAFTAFFKRLKKGEKPGYPQFKKKGIHDSFYVHNQDLRVDGRRVSMPTPRSGWVRTFESLRFDGEIVGATVSREGDRWYIAIQVEVSEYKKPRTGDEIVGVDLGIEKLATLSTGERIDGPKPLEYYLDKLRRLSKQHSRKQKGSNNRRKSAMKLARLHARIGNIRRDALHKLTTRLCSENQTVAIEDLDVKGMSANRKLARQILDMGWSEFRRQLDYKAKVYGTQIVVADKFYASSKTCSRCGRRKEDLSLSERKFVCEECGFEENRDVNAALNLRTLGQSGTNAWGQESSGPDGGSRRNQGETGLDEPGTKYAHAR